MVIGGTRNNISCSSFGVPIGQSKCALDFAVVTDIKDVAVRVTPQVLMNNISGWGVTPKLRAVYPTVGGTATTHKYNLINPVDTDAAFRLQYFGGWAHGSTGAKPNGGTAYADTFFTSANMLNQNAIGFGYYSRTNSNGTEVEMGWAQDILLEIRTSGVTYFRANQNVINSSFLDANSQGDYYVARTGVNIVTAYKNSSIVASNTITSATPSAGQKLYLGAWNSGGTPAFYSTKEYAIAHIDDGLNSTEVSRFRAAKQVFNTMLYRQV
jgi:hypothetical protein